MNFYAPVMEFRGIKFLACLSVTLSVEKLKALTFEPLEIETLYLACMLD